MVVVGTVIVVSVRQRTLPRLVMATVTMMVMLIIVVMIVVVIVLGRIVVRNIFYDWLRL